MIQTAIVHPGAFGQLKGVLTSLSAKSVLLISGNSTLRKTGVSSSLNELNGLRISKFQGVRENPHLEQIRAGIHRFKNSDAEVVLAIGGGSVIDFAKATICFADNQADPQDILDGKAGVQPARTPLVAVPTTSGSGSESTHFAVVYSGGKKYSLAEPSILPRYAIVDSKLTESMPSRLTAVCGMDALCQAIESFWSVNSTDESRSYALDAIRLAFSNLPKAVETGNSQARQAMCQASNLAGKAINISKTTAPHAFSYTMTSRFGIPHGHAVALTLPKFYVFNASGTNGSIHQRKDASSVASIFEQLNAAIGGKDAHECAEIIARFMNSLGLETRLSDLGIDSEDQRAMIADNVNLERLANNPRPVSKQEAIELLRGIA